MIDDDDAIKSLEYVAEYSNDILQLALRKLVIIRSAIQTATVTLMKRT